MYVRRLLLALGVSLTATSAFAQTPDPAATTPEPVVKNPPAPAKPASAPAKPASAPTKPASAPAKPASAASGNTTTAPSTPAHGTSAPSTPAGTTPAPTAGSTPAPAADAPAAAPVAAAVAAAGPAFSADTCDAKSLDDLDSPALTLSQLSEVCSAQAPFVARVAVACPNAVREFNQAQKKICSQPANQPDPKDLKLVQSAYLVTRMATKSLPPAALANTSMTEVHAEGATPTPASIFAQGVGDFLTTRAEQEVSAYATVELYSRACSDSDIEGFLPKTCALLAQQDNGSDPVGLGTLSRVMQSDVQSLPQNAVVMALKRAKTAEEKAAVCVADVGFALVSAAGKVPDVRSVIVPDFKLRDYGAPADKTTDCDAIWKNAESALKAVFKDPTTALSNSAGLSTAGNGDAKDLTQAVLDLVDAIQALQKEKDADAKKQDRIEVVKRAVIVVKLVKGTLASVKVSDDLIQEVGDIAAPLWNREWVGAAAALATAQHVGQAILCGGETEECERDRKVRLVVSVAADIAEAKSSADVQGALNRLAEPIGSWRRKFEKTFTLSLNGYAGAKFGAEWVSGDTPAGRFVAPHLALGVDWSFCLGKNQRLSLFTQVIDVGNVASVHLSGKDESGLTRVKADSDVTVKQLFAPGVYLMVAPAKTPFVLGVGGDWVPALRTTFDGNQHSAWQFGVTAAVDVPILELAHE